jgi:hypothetical protein
MKQYYISKIPKPWNHSYIINIKNFLSHKEFCYGIQRKSQSYNTSEVLPHSTRYPLAQARILSLGIKEGSETRKAFLPWMIAREARFAGIVSRAFTMVLAPVHATMSLAYSSSELTNTNCRLMYSHTPDTIRKLEGGWLGAPGHSV